MTAKNEAKSETIEEKKETAEAAKSSPFAAFSFGAKANISSGLSKAETVTAQMLATSLVHPTQAPPPLELWQEERPL